MASGRPIIVSIATTYSDRLRQERDSIGLRYTRVRTQSNILTSEVVAMSRLVALDSSDA